MLCLVTPGVYLVVPGESLARPGKYLVIPGVMSKSEIRRWSQKLLVSAEWQSFVSLLRRIEFFSSFVCEYLNVDMQYEREMTVLLEEIVGKLKAIDQATSACPSHKLDSFEPLIQRLTAIRDDLAHGNRLLPAIRKTNDLNARLAAASDLADPRYRSTLAALLGSYQPRGKPPKSKLGGLKGGRPRKDGKPVQTLERKGYSAENLPAKKEGKKRVHPPLQLTMVRSQAGMQNYGRTPVDRVSAPATESLPGNGA